MREEEILPLLRDGCIKERERTNHLMEAMSCLSFFPSRYRLNRHRSIHEQRERAVASFLPVLYSPAKISQLFYLSLSLSPCVLLVQGRKWGLHRNPPLAYFSSSSATDGGGGRKLLSLPPSTFSLSWRLQPKGRADLQLLKEAIHGRPTGWDHGRRTGRQESIDSNRAKSSSFTLFGLRSALLTLYFLLH